MPHEAHASRGGCVKRHEQNSPQNFGNEVCLPLPGVSCAVWQGKAQFDALSSADPSAVRNATQRNAAHDSFASFGGH